MPIGKDDALPLLFPRTTMNYIVYPDRLPFQVRCMNHLLRFCVGVQHVHASNCMKQ